MLPMVNILIRSSNEVREWTGDPVPLLEILLHDPGLPRDSRVEASMNRIREMIGTLDDYRTDSDELTQKELTSHF
jgi:hypothetical protein